jgi:crotonobetainyl-CoA:carnitine CoA-transferase CaiB-like acyl-CoA transferase
LNCVQPLSGIRVLDTSTGPVGGLATMVLADFGADVIKVEPPGGDRFRSLPASPLWLRGKRSVVLDLHRTDDQARLHNLVRHSDVVVVSGPPDRPTRWGIDATGAESLQPSIVHCSITGWGERGPLANLPGYASAVAARAGRMQAFAGQVQRPGPVFAAMPVNIHAAAHGAVQGILSALIVRDRGGGAQRVTTSLLQSLLPFDLVELLLVQLAERGDIEMPPRVEMPTLNYHPVMSKDGVWIQCGNLLEHLFLSFLDAIDVYGELLEDERFLEPPVSWTPDAVEHARDRILLRMQEKTVDEWMHVFNTNGNVAAEPYRTPAQALAHPDLVDNAAVVTLHDKSVGDVTMIGAIANLTGTPAHIERPAPLVGEHNGELQAEMLNAPVASNKTTSSDLKPSRSVAIASATAGRPLDGITIVEFASVIAAPLGTSMLGDLGARVIRIEPIEGDSFRQITANGSMTVKTTASKESICIDLKQASGRALARSLIAKADALVHNYRPGVPERLGIGFEDLHAEFPKLVWVAVNGYGPLGPGAHRPATHPVAGACMGGAGYQAGAASTHVGKTLEDVRETARQIMRANEPSPDPNTSVIVASSTLLGLVARERFGIGQSIFVDMMCANAHANADAFLHYDQMKPRPTIDPQHFGTGPCHRLYSTKSGWVFLTITTDAEWKRFCAAGGCEALLTDTRFTTNADRTQNAEALELSVTEALRAHTAPEWEAIFAKASVSCVQADAATPGEFFANHEQMHINGFVPIVNHARFGKIRRWGSIVTVGGPTESYGPGVLAGEHTDAILNELGFNDPEIAAMRSARIVASVSV